MWKHRVQVCPSKAISCSGTGYAGATNSGPYTEYSDAYNAREEWLSSEYGRFHENPCQHYTIVRECLGGSVSAYENSNHYPNPWVQGWQYRLWNFHPQSAFVPNMWNGSMGPWGAIESPLGGIPSLFTPTGEEGIVNLPSDWDTLVGQSYEAMFPGVRSRLSLINSVYELKDVKSLPRTAAKMYQSYRQAKRFIDAYSNLGRLLISDSTRGHWRKLTLKQLSRTGSDMYLQYMFNLSPLVSDIRAVKALMFDVKRQVEDLLNREGLDQSHHFKRELADTYPDAVENPTSSFKGSGSETFIGETKFSRYVMYDKRLFTGSLRYSFELPGWNREHALLEGFLDALGVQLNPAVIWNAIPWSFVVDWVFGVSRWLNQFKMANLWPSMHITGASHSLHVKRRISTSIQCSTSGVRPGTGNTAPLFAVYEEAYRRIPNSSTGVTQAIQLSGFSLKELSLAAALKLS